MGQPAVNSFASSSPFVTVGQTGFLIWTTNEYTNYCNVFLDGAFLGTAPPTVPSTIYPNGYPVTVTSDPTVFGLEAVDQTGQPSEMSQTSISALPISRRTSNNSAAAFSLLVSPDSKRVYSVGEATGAVFQTWDAATGDVLANVALPDLQGLPYLTMTPDDRWIYIRSAGSVGLVDLSSSTVQWNSLQGASSYSSSITISPDGQSVYTADLANSQFWTLRAGTLTITGPVTIEPFTIVTSLVVSPDNATLYLAGTRSGTAYDLTSRTTVNVVESGTVPYWSVAATAQHVYLTRTGSPVDVFSPRLQALQGTITVSGTDADGGLILNGAALSPDEKWLYVVDYRDFLLNVVDLAAGQLLATLAIPEITTCVAPSPDGLTLYLSARDGWGGANVISVPPAWGYSGQGRML
jgi:sugar lactone lactonase YvrE